MGRSVGGVAFGDPILRRKLAWASTVLSAVWTVLYLVLIIREGDDTFWEIFPWALAMLLGTSAALTAALSRDGQVARRAAVAATAVLGVLGIVGIFSIGLGFLVAAVLAGLAAAQPTKAVTG
jgi:hypothetical protein